MPSKPGRCAMWLAPVFMRTCAAAPRMVQQNTSPTGWRREGFSEICLGSVTAALNVASRLVSRLTPFPTEYQAFATIGDCGTKESSNRGRCEERASRLVSRLTPFPTEYQAFATIGDCGTKESSHRGRCEERASRLVSRLTPFPTEYQAFATIGDCGTKESSN